MDLTESEVNAMNAQTRVVMALTAMVLLGQPVRAQPQQSLMFAVRQCNEYALELHLDPRPFQDFVGPGFPLALVEGKARVVIIVHDCSQLWIDGQDEGLAQEVRVWLSIRGLEDVRPVVGAERTPPTRTWFSLFEGSSNPLVYKVKTAAGIAEASVDSVILDPPGRQGGGRVYLNGDLALSWHVPSPAAPSARLLGLNHDVFRRDSTGSVVLNQIQAVMHVAADTSPGTLEVTGRPGAVPLISPGTYPVSVRMFFPMWSRATLGLSRQTH
ncbi:MAG TPA: hypothetical protein VMS93_13150 [Candidatus Saccharimonadales bacterium]|nr:hypothetical protein [Candidatus Saccharimonadales bacterium]